MGEYRYFENDGIAFRVKASDFPAPAEMWFPEPGEWAASKQGMGTDAITYGSEISEEEAIKLNESNSSA